jgi:hypothetical protein
VRLTVNQNGAALFPNPARSIPILRNRYRRRDAEAAGPESFSDRTPQDSAVLGKWPKDDGGRLRYLS